MFNYVLPKVKADNIRSEEFFNLLWCIENINFIFYMGGLPRDSSSLKDGSSSKEGSSFNFLFYIPEGNFPKSLITAKFSEYYTNNRYQEELIKRSLNSGKAINEKFSKLLSIDIDSISIFAQSELGSIIFNKPNINEELFNELKSFKVPFSISVNFKKINVKEVSPIRLKYELNSEEKEKIAKYLQFSMNQSIFTYLFFLFEKDIVIEFFDLNKKNLPLNSFYNFIKCMIMEEIYNILY